MRSAFSANARAQTVALYSGLWVVLGLTSACCPLEDEASLLFMKRLFPILLFVLASCSAPTTPAQKASLEGPPPPAAATSPAALPRTYWALDYTAQRNQPLVAGSPPCRIAVVTTCLNDSAVVNPVTLAIGPGLDVSHNYASELTLTHGTHVWQRARLTKELFRTNPVAQTLGPLSELVLSRTEFVRYQAPEYRFATRLGVPDSDLFVEAEVALTPNRGLRVVSVREQEQSATE
jgi:hypothetical protein